MLTLLLKTSPKDLAEIYNQVAGETGLPASFVEKDFWLCLVMEQLFSLEGVGQYLTFKGGTSLSKVYNLIYRFSEDIDVTIDRHVLGYRDDPSASRKAKKRALETLHTDCRRFVQGEILTNLRVAFELALRAKWKCRLRIDEQVQDGQTILCDYPTVFESGHSYVKQTVRIEFGARSDSFPAEIKSIKSLVSQQFPNLISQHEVSVKTLAAERTFWEKCMLLHEWRCLLSGKELTPRQARHYYDVYCMINAGVGKKAAEDIKLFEAIRDHRKAFFNRGSLVDYDCIAQGSINIIPADEQLLAWKNDYKAMKDMFYLEPPVFEAIVETINRFQDDFNNERL